MHDALTAAIHERLAPSRTRLSANASAIVDQQIELTSISAPTGDERRRGEWIAKRFESLGLAMIDVDSAGNVIGRRPGRRDLPAIAICAHLDTVFPSDTSLAIRRDGSRVLGPGITDNGRGLAAMLALADELRADRVPTDHPVEFVATTGEEGAGDLRGAKHYFATRGAECKAAIIVDGAGDERIVHRALGSRRYRITFDGPGGHSWTSFGTANAVHTAAAAATAIAAIRLPVDPRTTLTVARIGGGLSVNSIPAQAWMEVDLRSSSVSVLRDVSVAVERAVREAARSENARRVADSDELRVRIEPIGDRPCGETDANDPLVRSALAATRHMGRTPDLAMASTDANVPISLGIPAVGIGGGGFGGDTHTTAEWYDDTGGSVGIARALTIVVRAATAD